MSPWFGRTPKINPAGGRDHWPQCWTILFAGGGTAGHLFPGLAVAEDLRRHAPHLRMTFAGTGKSFELEQLQKAGFDYFSLPCRPFPRKAREALRFLTDNLSGYYAARRYLREQNVSLVVGLGGLAGGVVSPLPMRVSALAGMSVLVIPGPCHCTVSR